MASDSSLCSDLRAAPSLSLCVVVYSTLLTFAVPDRAAVPRVVSVCGRCSELI